MTERLIKTFSPNREDDTPDPMVQAGVQALIDLGCDDGCDPDCSCRDVDAEDMADLQRAVRVALNAALAGRAVVDLPEPEMVERGVDHPGTGSAYWSTATDRPARAAVIVSQGAADKPILMVDGWIWQTEDARAFAMNVLAAVQYAERFAAEQSSGVAGGDTR